MEDYFHVRISVPVLDFQETLSIPVPESRELLLLRAKYAEKFSESLRIFQERLCKEFQHGVARQQASYHEAVVSTSTSLEPSDLGSDGTSRNGWHSESSVSHAESFVDNKAGLLINLLNTRGSSKHKVQGPLLPVLAPQNSKEELRSGKHFSTAPILMSSPRLHQRCSRPQELEYDDSPGSDDDDGCIPYLSQDSASVTSPRGPSTTLDTHSSLVDLGTTPATAASFRQASPTAAIAASPRMPQPPIQRKSTRKFSSATTPRNLRSVMRQGTASLLEDKPQPLVLSEAHDLHSVAPAAPTSPTSPTSPVSPPRRRSVLRSGSAISKTLTSSIAPPQQEPTFFVHSLLRTTSFEEADPDCFPGWASEQSNGGPTTSVAHPERSSSRRPGGCLSKLPEDLSSLHVGQDPSLSHDHHATGNPVRGRAPVARSSLIPLNGESARCLPAELRGSTLEQRSNTLTVLPNHED
mmetsp:Transcript_29236/g.62137  ORF Transcript_29236/g.62137 Transcript_29236/m.62137 type:complete len:466 (+) Transcript_29236:1-1398(+)